MSEGAPPPGVKNLVLWQRAMQLTVSVYRCTELFPRSEMFGLTNQLRRAAVSIPSTIAEGYGRNSRREYCRFLAIARGSTAEVQTQLAIALELNFSAPEQIAAADALTDEVGRMLSSAIKRLKAAGNPAL